MKKILFIATGGTIASAKTENGLTPAITSDELLNAVPQVKNLWRGGYRASRTA